MLYNDIAIILVLRHIVKPLYIKVLVVNIANNTFIICLPAGKYVNVIINDIKIHPKE